jgi:exopolysaccharide biosynthesis polyprenyl glycosylphosphotransferase
VSADASPIWEVIPGVDGASCSPGMEAAMRRDAIFRRALAVSDLAGSLLALVVALYLVSGPTVQPRWTVVLLGPLVVVLSKAIGLYDRDQFRLRKATIDELPSLLNLAVFYALAVWLTESVLFDGSLNRPQVFVLTLASFILTAAGRVITRTVALRLTPAERCLVIGSIKDCDRATEALGPGRHAGTNAVVVGRVGLGDRSRRATDVRNDLPQVRSVISEAIVGQAVERVILVPDGSDQEEVLDLIRLIKALGVKLSVLPRLLEVVGSASAFDELDGLSLLGVRPYGLSKSSGVLKRAMDLAAATLLLLVFSPLLLLVAVAIKLDSHGPVLFAQRRIGRRGQLFGMVKFRSMVPDAEQIKDRLRVQNEVQGGLFKITDDPRITRVGRLLRKSSLDELPQLLNVLRGEMSLVGPRPLVPDEDVLIEGWRRRRLAVKPGMTGLWQIFGSSRIPMHEMVKLDYMYGANWSLWLDLKILIRTIPYMLSRRGV